MWIRCDNHTAYEIKPYSQSIPHVYVPTPEKTLFFLLNHINAKTVAVSMRSVLIRNVPTPLSRNRRGEKMNFSPPIPGLTIPVEDVVGDGRHQLRTARITRGFQTLP